MNVVPDHATREHPVGGVVARIRSLKPELVPAEQQVAEVLLDRQSDVVELTSGQVAELAGTSRATVVRAAQSLGFSGYQQLRVLLARDAALAEQRATTPTEVEGTAAAAVARFKQVAEAVPGMLALLDLDSVNRAVVALADAGRVQVVAGGLSQSLAVDAVARLQRLGIDAQAQTDQIQQQICARLLTPQDVALVISGSGRNQSTMQVVDAAQAAGAQVIVVTAFARSPLALLADVCLVVGMPAASFGDELTDTSRIPQVILIEGLMASLRMHLGERGSRALALALEEVSGHVDE